MGVYRGVGPILCLTISMNMISISVIRSTSFNEANLGTFAFLFYPADVNNKLNRSPRRH